MRTGRLLTLLLILQDGGRFTAAALAERLGVSERTVLRDIEVLSGSGVPVYGTRGPGGGFQLLDTFDQRVQQLPTWRTQGTGRLRRVRVRIAPAMLQRVLLTGTPDGWRPRRNSETAPDRPEWVEGSFRFGSDDAALRELVALAPEVEVVLPVALRDTMAAIGRRITSLHAAS